MYQKSVDMQDPRASIKPYPKINDDFYNQLIYVLTGETKTVLALHKFNNIDITWVALRTIGIFRNNENVEDEY
jgi:hypothetical protein